MMLDLPFIRTMKSNWSKRGVRFTFHQVDEKQLDQT